MKTFFVSVTLFIIAMFIIPVGGMCQSNANCNFYMYGFLGCEILCFASIVRLYLISKIKIDKLNILLGKAYDSISWFLFGGINCNPKG